jgi:hypothetical protein
LCAVVNAQREPTDTVSACAHVRWRSLHSWLAAASVVSALLDERISWAISRQRALIDRRSRERRRRRGLPGGDAFLGRGEQHRDGDMGAARRHEVDELQLAPQLPVRLPPERLELLGHVQVQIE